MELNDAGGRVNQVLEGNMSLFVGLGGLAFIPARVLSFIAQYLNIPATAESLSALGRASYWTVSVGTVLFGVFYFAFGIWAGVQLVQLARYLCDKVRFEGPDALSQARYLSSQLFPAPLELNRSKLDAQVDHSFFAKVEAALFSKELPYTKREELTLSALEELAGKFKLLQEHLKNDAKELLKKGAHPDGTALTPEEIDQLNELIVRKPASLPEIKQNLRSLLEGVSVSRRYSEKNLGSLGYDVSKVSELGLSGLEQYGLKVLHQRSQLKKEAALGRLMGGSTVTHLKKALNNGLIERLRSSDPVIRLSAEKEFEGLQMVERKALIVEGLYFAACFAAAALGIAVTVLSFTSPMGGVLFLSVSIAMALTMLGVDLRGMVQSLLSKERPGKYDKAYALFLGGMMVAAYLACVGVTLGLGLSLTPLLVGGLGVLFPGVVLAGGSYVMADQKQKRWDETHLSLEQLQEQVHIARSASEINGLIKRTVARGALRAQYLKDGKKVQGKGRSLLKKAASHPDEDLKRASRKTVKLFWKMVDLAPVESREKAIRRAELIQKYDDLIAADKITEARAQLRKLRRVSGQVSSALREQLYLIKAMKADVDRFEEAVAEALTQQQIAAQQAFEQQSQFLRII
jgi:hypothetical protein